MLCYRCGGHVKDGSDKCVGCGQRFDPALMAGPAAGFGAGIKRPRYAVEGAPCAPGDLIAARYQIKDHLGAGPLGWLFRATEASTDAVVALKILSPRFLQMPEEKRVFVEELHKAQRLVHPNIARIYQAGDDDGLPFIAAQYLEGLTLRRIMDLRRQKGQRFTLQEVEPIVAQIAAALEAAGSAFAHGNLKADNVIVLPDLLKLTDFGLAVSLPRAPFMAAQKAAGVHRYFAPEFLLGEPLDARTDVFSLGVMLAEMLGGAPYEAQLSLTEKNPALPEPLEALVRRAASPRPGARFPNAAEMAAELSELVAQEPRRAPAPPVTEDAGDVVIVEAYTDPRLRIARALGATPELLTADIAVRPAPSRSRSTEPEPGVKDRPRRGVGRRGKEKLGKGRRRTLPPGALAIGPTTLALEPIEPDVRRFETPAKVAPVARIDSPARPVSPSSGRPSSFATLEDERPSRAPLFAMGAVALIVLAGGGWSVLSSRGAEAKPTEAAADSAKATAKPEAPRTDAKAERATAEAPRFEREKSEPPPQIVISSRRDGDAPHHSMRDRVRAVRERVEKALADRKRQQEDALAAARTKPANSTRRASPARQ